MGKRKFVFRSRCAGCVWNNRPLCGRDYCMLPRCIGRGIPGAPHSPAAGTPTCRQPLS